MNTRTTRAGNEDLRSFLEQQREVIDPALLAMLPSGSPSSLANALAYPLAAGGKRLRPILARASAEAVGGSPGDALPAAVALEYVHTYSLVHDDLPAMDDDDLRRGQPTTHKVFGEAMAILVGDGLLTAAFEVLTSPESIDQVGVERASRLVAELARAAGASGMVGGQVIDMESEGRRIDRATLEELHRGKTGALLRASCVMGGIAGGGAGEDISRLATFGECIGLAFQITDDILDVTQTTEQLGKPQGSDAAQSKSTFVTLLGIDASREQAQQLIDRAHQVLAPLGQRARTLHALADYVIERTH